MTTPNHREQAETLLTQADHWFSRYEEHGLERARDCAEWMTATAQVHATLHLADVTADERLAIAAARAGGL
jgi:hypothetical protein